MAKENKPAPAYAGQTDFTQPYEAGASVMNKLNPSISGISKGNYAPVNPHGTGVMRGYGAATKGRKISGKMG